MAKVVFVTLVSMSLLGCGSLMAQVSFTQTTNADFNKGALNNVIVSGDNVYLQYSASGVGSWLTTTVLPQTISGHRAVSWNNRYAYVVGGYNDINYLSTVYMADIQSGSITSWSAQNALPVALRDPAVVIGTNTIYVMGGRDGSQVYNTIYYAAINTDGTLGTWQTSAVTLPANLWGHTATYVMGYIYVIGGSNSMTESTALNTVHYTRVNALNTLSAFTSGTMLVARNRHSAVTYNNKLYVLGGYDNSGNKSNQVYSATPALNGSIPGWALNSTMPQPVSNHSSVVTNGVITVMAGAVGATLSNTVYYANADAVGALSWLTSGNVMYDFTKDGAAFTGNGQIYYTGGFNLSGTSIINCRYANMTLTSNYIAHGVFVGNPFYELGTERIIDSLTFHKSYTAPANLQVNYRMAGSDGIWSNWSGLTPTSPIIIGLTRQYLQYAVILTGSGINNSTLNDMTLFTPGTELSGNLNSTATFTKALSPYWVTGDISFTSGTHTFQAGTTLLFLPQTGLTVSQANVICNGTAVDSVKFLYFTAGSGNWDGLYFDPNSDNGVSSQFYYTVISGAGYGSNNANLTCYQTNEPLLSRCHIRYADGHGIHLNSSHINIQNSLIRANMENGLYLAQSSPTLVSSTISYNTGAGVSLTNAASNPNYSAGTVTIDHNTYALRYETPNLTISQPNGNPVLSSNTYNGIAITGGDISSNQRWNAVTYDYILLETVRIGVYAGASRLTIEPGNTIKSIAGVQLQIGIYSSYGGELYALGTSGSPITFTSHNGLAGGWEGIYFTDWSDNWGGHSQLDYCIIEKGNDYNYYSVNTVQPDLINNSIIRNALQDGARYNNATGSITNCQFLTNGRYPVYFLNPEANPTHTGNTYTGNLINRIALSGGTYSFNRTYNNDNVFYYVLDDIIMAQYAGSARITVDPGVVMEFALGKKLQLGASSSFGGELYAVGLSTSTITFRAYSGAAGGWEGIYFTQWNDNWGGSSTMEYCTVRNANAQNILIEGSSSQPVFNNCTIRGAASNGIVVYQSSPVIQNTSFISNIGYPLKFNDWTCNAYLRSNTYTSNGQNYIALSGGFYDGVNRTIYYQAIPYQVLGDIVIGWYAWHSRLTIQPGVTMLFDPGIKLRLGYPSSYGGDLWAEGKSDSLITFKPFNDLAGGWGGIYFTEWNDNWSGTSSMKYCVVEKGASYNVNCVGSGQPAIDHCTFKLSTGNGLVISSSNLTIRNSNFVYNATNGIYLDGTGTGTIGNTYAYTCNIFNNGTYELYNDGSADVNARYNYWGTGDSTMVGFRIYDKSDNSAKGRVNYVPFAQVTSLSTTNTLLSGTVKYANLAATTIKNAPIAVKTFAGTTIASTTTNTSGVFAFPSFASGNYQMTISPVAPAWPWTPCNATDALGILNHFAMIAPLSGIKMGAADVNASHTINGTDAMHVLKRFNYLITTFPAGDVLYDSDTVIVNGSNVTDNIRLLYFGDVDASFIPAKKSVSSLGLVIEGKVLVDSYTDFEFPVRLKTGMKVGALSLGFHFPTEYLEITGVRLASSPAEVSWNTLDGTFRMAWADLNSLTVADDEVMVIISMKTKDLTNLATGIELEICDDAELADPIAVPNDGAVIAIPAISTKSIGIGNEKGLTGLSVYPNPVTMNSVASFTLPGDGKIRLTLLNAVGTRMVELVDANLSSGNHRIPLKTAGLTPGMYFLKMEITDSSNSYSDIVKIVISE